MKALLFLFVLASGVVAHQHSDPAQLALAIVNVARNDAGIGPNPTRGRLATGPFLLDSLTFATHFDLTFGPGVSTTVIQTLLTNGYSFGNHDTLRRSATDSTGLLRHTLEGDAIVLNLVGLIRAGDTAIARVTMFYTENGDVCPRTLELTFAPSGTTWSVDDKKVIGDC